MNLSMHQAFDARLKLAILGSVDERVDTAVHEHHHHAEVVEPGRIVDSSAEHTDHSENLIG